MRQHIAAKSHDTGYKVWMLIESTTNYVYDFDIYTGKGAKSETGQATRVVNQLVQRLHRHCWHVIGMDGFFSSVPLFLSLYEQGFYGVATTRHNRTAFPKTLLIDNRALDRGEWVYRQMGDLVCVSWMDKKPVNFLSTHCDPETSCTIERRGESKEKIEVTCPEVVLEYHRWMRGVDVFSQRESYYRVGRAKKWWPRLAWFLIGMGISNAYALYTFNADKPINQKEFRKQLSQAMVATYTARKKRGRQQHSSLQPATEHHIPMHRTSKSDCVVCRKKRRYKMGEHAPRTKDGCKTCNVAVHLECWVQHLPVDVEEDDRDTS
jgi:Transposase IS4